MCETCGGPLSRQGKIYCSRRCANGRPGRRGGSRSPRVCEICGSQFKPNGGGRTVGYVQRTCSRACGVELRRRIYGYAGRSAPRSAPKPLPAPKQQIRCSECGRKFIASSSRKTCGSECARRRGSRITSERIMRRYRQDPEFRAKVMSKARQRRADRLGAPGKITSPAALVEYLMARDHGRCGICRKPVRAKRGPMRPSIDHIVPLTRDGEHTLENVQLAHLRCNLAKGNRGGGQILLVG